ncbi:MAG: amidohydrolase [Spirochaetales bacterium]|nr:amidohydrolase [Spirochaetales bacterium]
MVPAGLIDSHLHIGDEGRIDELRRYADLLGLTRLGVLSLPTAGVADRSASGVARLRHGIETVNFNPEVLATCAVLAGRADGFGSFDNRALVAGGGGVSAWNPARQVAEMAAAGFRGIKMWEGKPELAATLGVHLDDTRYLDAYREAARRAMPILIHVADPQLFWKRGDAPWSYANRTVSTFEELIRQAGAVCDGAPAATFIFPHLLFLADEEAAMPRFLDEHPNAYFDLAPGNYLYPALGEARRVDEYASAARREAVRAFFTTYADRLLLGSDAFFLPRDLAYLPGTSLADNTERFLRLYRFLATDDAFASPYAPTADTVPLMRGLALERETVTTICIDSYRRVMAEAPRRIDRASARAYLEGWGSGAPRSRGRAAAAIERVAAAAP